MKLLFYVMLKLVFDVLMVLVVLVWYLGNNGLGMLFGNVLLVLWCIFINFIGIFCVFIFCLMVLSVGFVVLLLVLIIIFNGVKLFKFI